MGGILKFLCAPGGFGLCRFIPCGDLRLGLFFGKLVFGFSGDNAALLYSFQEGFFIGKIPFGNFVAWE
jgi:hypothetical protein